MNDKEQLRRIILKKGIFHGEKIKLSAGKLSNIYFDLKPVMLDNNGGSIISLCLTQKIMSKYVDFVGGLEMGAVPLVSMLPRNLFIIQSNCQCFFMRKEIKGHGTSNLIEGIDPENFKDKSILLLDDVSTSGESLTKTVKILEQYTPSEINAFTIIDREEGATELLAEYDVKLESLFRKADFEK